MHGMAEAPLTQGVPYLPSLTGCLLQMTYWLLKIFDLLPSWCAPGQDKRNCICASETSQSTIMSEPQLFREVFSSSSMDSCLDPKSHFRALASQELVLRRHLTASSRKLAFDASIFGVQDHPNFSIVWDSAMLSKLHLSYLKIISKIIKTSVLVTGRSHLVVRERISAGTIQLT